MIETKAPTLIVAAHPDDEALGCGGTIAKIAEAGGEVHVLFLSEGVTARDETCDLIASAPEIAKREENARAAARVLGAQEPHFLRLPDNRLDQMDLIDIAKLVEAEIRRVTPATIYCHHGADLNVDHRITFQSVLTACRPISGLPVQRIYSWETNSSTEWATPEIGPGFVPNRFVEISDTLDKKRESIDCYAEEMRPFPHPRSWQAIEALARWRGATSGLLAAEAFQVIREIC
jgi:N-acetylglucosamine malate deacetylase 1